MRMRSKPGYQVEPVGLRDGIWERGYITAWELLRICAWKSAKGVALLSLNAEAEIEERTRNACTQLRWLKDADALDPSTDWDRWTESVRLAIGAKKLGTGLLGLSGVGYPVATAVLCILNPRTFPVLDRWAVAGLYGDDRKSVSYERAARYSEYAQDLVRAGSSQQLGASSIHELDQLFMNAAMA